MGGQQHISLEFAQKTNQLTLQICVQIYLRLVNDDQGRLPRPHEVCEQLAPNLKTRAYPIQLPRDPTLVAEHHQLSGGGICNKWPLNLHPRPRASDCRRELIEIVTKVVPITTEIPRSTVRGYVCLNSLRLNQGFSMFDGPQNRNY